MNQVASTSASAEQLRQQLLTHAARIQDPMTASKVYREFLTDAEREHVGPLEEAFKLGKTIGIWMRAKNVSFPRAIVELARQFGLPEGDYNSLLRRIGEPRDPIAQTSTLPVWDKDRSELWLDGELIKRFTRPGAATSQICILSNFSDDQWCPRIDDPISPKSKGRPTTSLEDAIKLLNRGLRRIHFRGDGTGKGVLWQRRVPSTK